MQTWCIVRAYQYKQVGLRKADEGTSDCHLGQGDLPKFDVRGTTRRPAKVTRLSPDEAAQKKDDYGETGHGICKPSRHGPMALGDLLDRNATT
mmetsp:Transcript_106471/g.189303  ORF Transcript_106471/g.189303 Transcript_106471/m.189303 type:complete len:93 (+) Transcript_106471:412-690(+)